MVCLAPLPSSQPRLSAAGSSTAGGAVLLGSGTLRSFQQHNGSNTFRFGVEHDQLLADDRRRCDATYSGMSLECGRQMWAAVTSKARRMYTMLRLRNPIMDSIRRFGLHLLQKETPPDGQCTVHMTSFRSTIVPADNNWAHPGYDDDNASISSGSLSPDLGGMWKYGCPRSLDWDSESDGELDDGAEEKKESEYVLEGPLWVFARICLVPDDVLRLRTTVEKWN